MTWQPKVKAEDQRLWDRLKQNEERLDTLITSLQEDITEAETFFKTHALPAMILPNPNNREYVYSPIARQKYPSLNRYTVDMSDLARIRLSDVVEYATLEDDDMGYQPKTKMSGNPPSILREPPHRLKPVYTLDSPGAQWGKRPPPKKEITFAEAFSLAASWESGEVTIDLHAIREIFPNVPERWPDSYHSITGPPPGRDYTIYGPVKEKTPGLNLWQKIDRLVVNIFT